jgi:hypothetical protein
MKLDKITYSLFASISKYLGINEYYICHMKHEEYINYYSVFTSNELWYSKCITIYNINHNDTNIDNVLVDISNIDLFDTDIFSSLSKNKSKKITLENDFYIKYKTLNFDYEKYTIVINEHKHLLYSKNTTICKKEYNDKINAFNYYKSIFSDN